MSLLEFRDVSVDFPTASGVVHAVRRVTLTVAAGHRMGIVGESGSGKTTLVLAALRLLQSPGFVSHGEICMPKRGNVNLLALSPEQMRQTRLQSISYIPQGAMNSLNPIMRIEAQIWDGIVTHEGRKSTSELVQRSRSALESVGLAKEVGRLFPHELSGGMKQRVCIAIGVSLMPDLMIADEPTSALDEITQRQVMHALQGVQGDIGAGLILIGHDMGLMAQSVDEIAVMRHGTLIERGPVRQILDDPKQAYTRQLMAAVPRVGGKSFLGNRSAHCKGEPGTIVELDAVSKRYGDRVALRPISLSIEGGDPKFVSVVGQSGSGKTTLGNLILGFSPPSEGRVIFRGQDIHCLDAARRIQFRKDVQAIFQDPYACFNPFYRVDHTLRYPFKRFGLAKSEGHVRQAMETACAAVGLEPTAVLGRYAHQLSGGQRQRLIVARALMLSPKLLIADEPVSMVDASLRASILGNVHDLKDKQGISVIYITHDLATAYHVSDFVLVLYQGRVVEAGPPARVIGDPRHAYTKLLINSIPSPDASCAWGSAADAKKELEAVERSASCSKPEFRGNVGGITLKIPV